MPREAFMQKRIIVLFDIAVLAGFGLYMARTVWQLPDGLRQRLLTAFLAGVLDR